MSNYVKFGSQTYYKSSASISRPGFVRVKCQVYSEKKQTSKISWGDSKVVMMSRRNFNRLFNDAVLNACYSAFPDETGYQVKVKDYYVLYDANKYTYKTGNANGRRYVTSFNNRSKKVKVEEYHNILDKKEKEKLTETKKADVLDSHFNKIRRGNKTAQNMFIEEIQKEKKEKRQKIKLS